MVVVNDRCTGPDLQSDGLLYLMIFELRVPISKDLDPLMDLQLRWYLHSGRTDPQSVSSDLSSFTEVIIAVS